MSESQAGLQLRQRGLGITAAGLLVQLFGALMVASVTGWAVILLPLVVAAVTTVLSYTSVKDRTGTANVANGFTVVLAALAAVVNTGWAGVLLILVGAIASFIGNKQLAAGIRF